MKNLKVLIVDDEQGMVLGISRILKNFEIYQKDFDETVKLECSTASSDDEALEKLEKKKYDLMILDYKLQNRTGLEIIEINKQKNRETITIMVTAFASIEVAVSATKQGAFDFIAKPFTPSELKVSVEKAVKHIYLREKARKLEAEKKAQRFQFISILAHELKSPIAAVEGYLNIMQEHIKGDNLSNYDEMIERSILRTRSMRKMIMDLLDLTKIESGKKMHNPTNINIEKILQISLETIENSVKEKNIDLEVHLSENKEFFIDSNDLEIILNNLLSNAVKYNKNNGKIKLTILNNKKELTIKCEDTGIGMKKEDLKKLFKEFVRIKNEKTRTILGSGLGLSIVKKTAKLYNGDVNVESKENEGTTFTITLQNKNNQ